MRFAPAQVEGEEVVKSGEKERRSERGRRKGGRTTTGASSCPPAPRGPGKHMAKCRDNLRVSGNDMSPCQP